jgi:hypothetical protein
MKCLLDISEKCHHHQSYIKLTIHHQINDLLEFAFRVKWIDGMQ